MLFSSRRLAHFETLTSAEADRAYSLEIKDVYLKKGKGKTISLEIKFDRFNDLNLKSFCSLCKICHPGV